MSKYLLKPFPIAVLGLSAASVLMPSIARSQAKPAKTIGGNVLPDPNAINKKIQQNYPPELLEGDSHHTPTQQSGSTTDSPVSTPIGKGINSEGGNTTSNGNVLRSSDGNTTTFGNANYTFVIQLQ